jgi:hypothetical protein
LNDLIAGSPLSLERLLRSSAFVQSESLQVLLRGHRGEGGSPGDDDDDNGMARFPPISQSEHPATGLPCFSLHPCETTNMLGEILRASDEEKGRVVDKVDIVEAWLSVVGAVVNLRD